MADKTHNLTELKKLIADSIRSVTELKKDRADVNAEIGAVRAKLVAQGIPKKAFDMAMAYINMDPDDREGFDVAYALVREAGGLPMQEDLFTAADRMGKTKVEASEPDATEIEKVIASQEADKVKGKKVHEPAGDQKGTIN
jgi:hypothetical protein